MPAYFQELNDVTQVLVEHIRAATGIADVQAGVPRDVADSTDPGVRLTLLYATPRPGHRNDPPEYQADGLLRPPPLVLSCSYLVTTSGADSADPVAALHALGRIMTLYHEQPQLQLPLRDAPGGPAGAFTPLGEGSLCVTQVPITLDQVDKIWAALDTGLQPWVLLEVAPVALVSRLADREPGPMVRPGGINLTARVAPRPQISRVSPVAVRAGGRVRIDVVLPDVLGALSVGGVAVAADDPSVAASPDGASILLSLDDGGLEALGPGTHRLSVRAAGLPSRAADLRISAAAAPAVDAPGPEPHDPADDLVLIGANLAAAKHAVLWPDGELVTPGDVHTLALAAVATGAVRIRSDELMGVSDRPGTWRLAITTGPDERRFTPYVLLELVP